MCDYPRLVPNKKYTANTKNGGVIPAVYDKRALATPAICGDCRSCRKQKAREWKVRLLEDIKTTYDNYKYKKQIIERKAQMITLTFSTEALRHIAEDGWKKKNRHTGEITTGIIKDLKGYDRDNAIASRAIRLFTERWRKETGKAPRHWLITELGHENTEHIHIHGIIWGNTDKIERIWNSGKVPYGFVWKGKMNYKTGRLENYVNGATVGYCVKYVSKMDVVHKTYKPIIRASKGIGKNYVERVTHTIECIETYVHRTKKGRWSLKDSVSAKRTYKRSNKIEQKFKYENTRDYYRTETGHKIGMPTYWRKKIYTDDEREALWMNKLDENIRWIDGQKIDLNKVDEEEYYKALLEAQEKGKQLGYKDGTKKWKREVYERERRNLIWEYRMKMQVIENEVTGRKSPVT